MTRATPLPTLSATSEAAEVQRLFDLQHAASRREPAPTLATRKERLDKVRTLMLENQDAIIAAVSADFGNRSADETRLLEVSVALGGIRHARTHLRSWMRPEHRHVDIAFQPASAWVRYEPLGVIGIISPWNYPVLLALAPLVDAFAAGNRAMIKPSELTPRYAELLRQLIAAAFDESEAAVVTGGPEIGQQFSSLPFDHLIFTGSTQVGRLVMKAAAANLTPVTLELGGKSPVIVAPDFPLEKAAASIALGKFLSAGQTCIAPDYALVPKAQVEPFARAVIAAAAEAFPTVAGNSDYTSIISQRHFDRLAGAIEEARSAGATVLSHDDPGAAAVRKIAPTVVIGAPAGGVLMTEEIFGPVLPIVGYDSLEEVLAIINGRDRPLALYCYTHDRATRDKVLDGATSGGVTLNGTLLHAGQDSVPFGGIGPSGIGGYHGHEGFLRFSHARSVLKVGFVNIFEKLGPPWGELARRTAGFLAWRR